MNADRATGIASFLAVVMTALPSSPALAADDRPIVAVFEIENKGPDLNTRVLGNLTVYLSARLATTAWRARASLWPALVAQCRGQSDSPARDIHPGGSRNEKLSSTRLVRKVKLRVCLP